MHGMHAGELILGGQRSGKSRRAEALALQWLAAEPERTARWVVTAWPGDEEMQARIERHRRDRAVRLPASRIDVQEVHDDLAAALRAGDAPGRLQVVDCLTLWVSQQALPPPGRPALTPSAIDARIDDLVRTVGALKGPCLLVSNEIGLGVTPVSPEARQVVDALGRLHQRLAAVCARVTLMVAGLPMTVKDEAAGVLR